MTQREITNRRIHAAVGLAWLAAALFFGPRAGAQDLAAGSGAADIGGFVSIPIEIASAPNDVDAFGFDVFFDASAVAYAGTFVEGELAQPFTFFDVTEPGEGRLRVAAFSIDDGIAAGANGLLLTIDFEVLACPPEGAAIAIGALVDDVAGWDVAPGSVECPMAMLSLSDTVLRFASAAGTSAVRVRNAGNGPLAWSATVMSGGEWLGVSPEAAEGDDELAIQFAANTTGAARDGVIRVASARSTPAFVDVTVMQSADGPSAAGDIVVGAAVGNLGDFVSVAIAIGAAPNEASAFGIDLEYDRSVLRHTGAFTAGELVDGFTLFDITEPEPGRLRLGAVAIETPISIGESGTLATLEFEIVACAEDATELNASGLVDHVESWETAPGAIACGAPVLVVSSTTVRVSAAAGSATVTISNPGEGALEWTADVVLGSWLSVSPGSGIGEGTLTIQYDANNGTQSRGGEIWIESNAGNSDAVIVEVIQAAPMSTGGMDCAAGAGDGERTQRFDWLLVMTALAIIRQWGRRWVQCEIVDRRIEQRRE